MTSPWIMLVAVLAGWPLAVGCDGASSAREPAPRPRAVDAPIADDSDAVADAPAVGKAANSAAPVAPPPPRTALLPPRDSSGVIDASFDDVKFEMEKTDLFQRSMLTPKIEALSGERIRIRGYMFPTSLPRGIKEFVLVRDNMECCFGPGAALFDCILVRMTPGKTAEFSIRPIAVEGTFRVEEYVDPGGRTVAIYQMTGDAVE